MINKQKEEEEGEGRGREGNVLRWRRRKVKIATHSADVFGACQRGLGTGEEGVGICESVTGREMKEMSQLGEGEKARERRIDSSIGR